MALQVILTARSEIEAGRVILDTVDRPPLVQLDDLDIHASPFVPVI